MTHSIETVQEDEDGAVQFVVNREGDAREVLRISFSGGRMTVAVAPHITLDDAARAFLSAVQRQRVN